MHIDIYHLEKEPDSLIHKIPDNTLPLYVMKIVDLVIMEYPVWDMGLVVICESIMNIQYKKVLYTTNQYAQKYFRCVYPLSRKMKFWHHDSGFQWLFSHFGIPHCQVDVFKNPKALIDHVLDASKQCIFHFIIGQIIKRLYQNTNWFYNHPTS